MYANASSILYNIDTQDQYIGTEFEGLDPFSRQLKRFDINENDIRRVELNARSTDWILQVCIYWAAT